MKKLSIKRLEEYLDKITKAKVMDSIMIWGAPGIGKSSVVSSVAKKNDLKFIDVRLSQLAPTDIRGLPEPRDGISYWCPPEFLPQSGSGILFFDELNMAPPAIQGIAQQLILDRQVGSYKVPDNWYIWSAGNRKEDHAAVFDMPAPLSNRFFHLEISTGLNEFKSFAMQNQIDDRIISFLNFRPNLLHKVDKNSPAWPSPRQWVKSNNLLKAKLDIDPAVGTAAASEFRSFCSIYKTLPNIDLILSGKGKPKFPDDLSAKYALCCALALRSKNKKQMENSLIYLSQMGTTEWLNQTTIDIFTILQAQDRSEELLDVLGSNSDLLNCSKEISKLLAA
ncbi:MoxR family ATPase [Bacteroidota bacterium]|jgi:hypothetical protein|nr:MoxR family ATPase [Bacteroidota bacterium]